MKKTLLSLACCVALFTGCTSKTQVAANGSLKEDAIKTSVINEVKPLVQQAVTEQVKPAVQESVVNTLQQTWPSIQESIKQSVQTAVQEAMKQAAEKQAAELAEAKKNAKPKSLEQKYAPEDNEDCPSGQFVYGGKYRPILSE